MAEVPQAVTIPNVRPGFLADRRLKRRTAGATRLDDADRLSPTSLVLDDVEALLSEARPAP